MQESCSKFISYVCFLSTKTVVESRMNEKNVDVIHLDPEKRGGVLLGCRAYIFDDDVYSHVEPCSMSIIGCSPTQKRTMICYDAIR